MYLSITLLASVAQHRMLDSVDEKTGRTLLEDEFEVGTSYESTHMRHSLTTIFALTTVEVAEYNTH